MNFHGINAWLTSPTSILLSAAVLVGVPALALGQAAPITRRPPQGSGSDIPEGYMLIHGDIVVPNDFYQQPEGTYGATTWPGGIVYTEGVTKRAVPNQKLRTRAVGTPLLRCW